MSVCSFLQDSIASWLSYVILSQYEMLLRSRSLRQALTCYSRARRLSAEMYWRNMASSLSETDKVMLLMGGNY